MPKLAKGGSIIGPCIGVPIGGLRGIPDMPDMPVIIGFRGAIIGILGLANCMPCCCCFLNVELGVDRELAEEGSKRCCRANRVMKASFPALCRAHCGRTTGWYGCGW